MGAQWKHAGKMQNSAKRGALISKLVKEITVSAKVGDPAPENNPRLRAAVEAAKKNSVPRDTIDRAIKKGSGQLDEQVNYEQITYEGFAPHQVPVLVECLTDNKNRTASDIRVLFRKGMLGSVGSVNWMFDRLGIVEAQRNLSDGSFDLEEVAIEVGAQDVEKIDSSELEAEAQGGRFICDPKDLNQVSQGLTDQGWSVTQSEMSYVAKNQIEVSEESRAEVIEFLNAIDDHDDVHRIYVALK